MSYDFEYYSGQYLKFPTKPVKPSLGRNPTAIDARAYADAMELYERELESYKEDYAYYSRLKNANLQEFKDRLIVEYNLSKSTFEFIWTEANETSDYDGLEAVFNKFEKLYDFVNIFNKISLKDKVGAKGSDNSNVSNHSVSANGPVGGIHE